MARGIKTKKRAKTIVLQKEEKKSFKSLKQNLIEQLRLSESYVSLILGAVVVLILSLAFFVFIKGNNSSSKESIPSADFLTPSVTKATEQTYILLQDEYLWDVAVKFYGDGFRWTDIAKANKLENPDYVPPGTKLIIPNAK